jgi:GcrA cell cycle regulator
MTDAAVTWTEERIDLLRRLWSEGLSASQIATEIGGVTRNAVIGKVHRLGLSGRGKAAAAAAAPQRPRKATRAPSAPAPLAQAESRPEAVSAPTPQPQVVEAEVEDAHEEVALPMSERVTIMDLRESMCRWPMGDPTKPEFRFCGARAVTGLPYCSHHARVAYQPVADRKRDRRIAARA